MNCCKEKKESLAAARRQEIIRACEELYEAVDYDAISIKEIAKSTSICRSNIYNYYETKEEIFLDILKKEYLLWMEDMKKLLEEDSLRSRSSYCRIIARTARHRPRLLKLISVHYVSIEKNCSLERLTDFKNCGFTARRAYCHANLSTIRIKYTNRHISVRHRWHFGKVFRITVIDIDAPVLSQSHAHRQLCPYFQSHAFRAVLLLDQRFCKSHPVESFNTDISPYAHIRELSAPVPAKH